MQPWAQMAEAARALVDNASYGFKERTIESQSKSLGVNSQTLRRALAAHEFALMVLSQFRLDLRNRALNSVEDIRRWHAYDPDGAIKAAGQLLSDIISVRRLKELEVEARSHNAKRLGSRASQRISNDEIIKSLSEFSPSLVVSRGSKLAFAPTVDISIHENKRDGVSVGILLFKPTVRKVLNRDKLLDLVVYALGVSRFYTHTVILFQDRDSYKLNGYVTTSIRSKLYRFEDYEVRFSLYERGKTDGVIEGLLAPYLE